MSDINRRRRLIRNVLAAAGKSEAEIRAALDQATKYHHAGQKASEAKGPDVEREAALKAWDTIGRKPKPRR